MTANVVASGSQTATISTEHTLVTETNPGTYVGVVDLANMVGGTTPDILEIRLYGKARSGDTERQIKCWSFVGVQTELLFFTVPLLSPHHWKLTLKQVQGTGRAFPWAQYGA